MISIPDDLESVLVANPIFRNKMATHDLLNYALKARPKHLAAITTEQLQRGDERLSQTSLMPPDAAKVITAAFC